MRAPPKSLVRAGVSVKVPQAYPRPKLELMSRVGWSVVNFSHADGQGVSENRNLGSGISQAFASTGTYGVSPPDQPGAIEQVANQ